MFIATTPTGQGRGINVLKIRRATHLLRIHGYGGQVGKLRSGFTLFDAKKMNDVGPDQSGAFLG
jgi:hypothetical protein